MLVLVDPGQQVIEIGWGELPLERPGGGVVALLEGSEALFDLVQGGEVVGAEDLALEDGEVDLDLGRGGAAAPLADLADTRSGATALLR
ncbi:MAG TPA: hypothetical protein VFQ77_10290 [Pseudonocardiaceae bacterium]|nr:hypothetical protein [Pseudonocardiaceae bacterium]